MDVVVLGAGSLGSLVGGLLARAHDVTLVGREPHVAAVRASGLRVRGLVEADVAPGAATTTPDAADLVVVTTKAHDTPRAAADLVGVDAAGVLSLSNGLGNEEALADGLDAPVLAGTATYGAVLREPGLVECTGLGTVRLGPLPGVTAGEDPGGLAARVGDAFAAAGLETTVEADMRRPLWTKLAVNAGVNPVTALARVPNGALADGPAADLAREAAREVAATARASGVDLGDDEVVAALGAVVDATADNVSSMRQDVEAGRRTEVDALNGAVVDRARAAAPDGDGRGVAPVNAALAALVRAWEAGRGLR